MLKRVKVTNFLESDQNKRKQKRNTDDRIDEVEWSSIMRDQSKAKCEQEEWFNYLREQELHLMWEHFKQNKQVREMARAQT